MTKNWRKKRGKKKEWGRRERGRYEKKKSPSGTVLTFTCSDVVLL